MARQVYVPEGPPQTHTANEVGRTKRLFKLPRYMSRRLEVVAKRTGLRQTDIVEAALAHYLPTLEAPDDETLPEREPTVSESLLLHALSLDGPNV